MLLDKLKATATGPDGIPYWFLRLGAPFLCSHIARLVNLSIATSTVPKQWKEALIHPIPKIPGPVAEADFRPISVTSVISRIMERVVVRTYVYPAIMAKDNLMRFSDQFAFRPTGSTPAALIAILQTITMMLAQCNNNYVHLISLDFSKAFDTVKHSSVVSKFMSLNLSDEFINWIVSFLTGRTHKTKWGDTVSEPVSILASVIQGSVIGPAAYAVVASDLKAITPGNIILKFADDSYLIVPQANTSSINSEIQHIQTWANQNNLSLNAKKSSEMIMTDKRSLVRTRGFSPPAEIPGINRVKKLTILGIIITDQFSMADHVDEVLKSCNQSLYAISILKAGGLNPSSASVVFNALVISKITYAIQAWLGFANTADRDRIQRFLNKCFRMQLCPSQAKELDELSSRIEIKYFKNVCNQPFHVLQPYLTQKRINHYDLRSRFHDRLLPTKTTKLQEANFLIRMMYLHSY